MDFIPLEETLSLKYPVGSRVELISLEDDHSDLVAGAKGTVSYIDTLGTVFVDWDSGSDLGLIPGVDRWKPSSS